MNRLILLLEQSLAAGGCWFIANSEMRSECVCQRLRTLGVSTWMVKLCVASGNTVVITSRNNNKMICINLPNLMCKQSTEFWIKSFIYPSVTVTTHSFPCVRNNLIDFGPAAQWTKHLSSYMQICWRGSDGAWWSLVDGSGINSTTKHFI